MSVLWCQIFEDVPVSEAVLDNTLLIPLKSCLSLQFPHNKDRLLTRNPSHSNKTSLKLSHHLAKVKEIDDEDRAATYQMKRRTLQK